MINTFYHILPDYLLFKKSGWFLEHFGGVTFSPFFFLFSITHPQTPLKTFFFFFKEGSQEDVSRPRIEDKLGLGSEDEDETVFSKLAQPVHEDSGGMAAVGGTRVQTSRFKRPEGHSSIFAQEVGYSLHCTSASS